MNRLSDYSHSSIGFSWQGLVVLALPMLPNVLFLVLENPNVSRTVTSHHPFLSIIEHGSQGIFAALLVLLVSRRASPMGSGHVVVIGLLLLAYFGLWVAYFTIGVNFSMLMFMAVVPVMYFVVAGIWLHNPPAVVFTAVFGVAHTAVTWLDFH